jgi:hypothetical protein
LTLIGNEPFAPADDYLVGTIDSAAYSTFEVDIFCATGSLPFDNWKSILHISSGTDWGNLGSRVFALWRDDDSESLFIASPGVIPGNSFAWHTCVANTYSTYKIIVSPDESDNSRSNVELIIDGIIINTLNYNKVKRYNRKIK